MQKPYVFEWDYNINPMNNHNVIDLNRFEKKWSGRGWNIKRASFSIKLYSNWLQDKRAISPEIHHAHAKQIKENRNFNKKNTCKWKKLCIHERISSHLFVLYNFSCFQYEERRTNESVVGWKVFFWHLSLKDFHFVLHIALCSLHTVHSSHTQCSCDK